MGNTCKPLAVSFQCMTKSTTNKKIKKIKKKRIDAFELWCWRRLLRVPWTAGRSSQSILKIISPEYSLERLMLKLRYFGHLIRRTDSLEKTLMLGRIKDRRRSGQQRMRCLDNITESMGMNLTKPLGIVKDRGAWSAESMGTQRVRCSVATE